MSKSNRDFFQIAEEAIQHISSAIEEADSGFELEVDTNGDSINIEFQDGSKYLINIHTSSKEIWVSSPVSGGSHFAYDEDEDSWRDSADNDMYELITEELEELGGVSIRL